MREVVFLLCASTSLTCAILLGRAYRATGVQLLLWSTVCFAALTLTNVLLFIDLSLLPSVDLRPFRSGVTLLGLTALLYGLVLREK